MAFSPKLHFILLSALILSVYTTPVSRKSTALSTLPPANTEARFLKKAWKKVKKTVKKVGGAVKHAAVCNPASKAAFATAFAAAAKAPAWNCPRMTAAEWRKVGCSNPAQHRQTRICAPAIWGGVLGNIVKASAMALKHKILFKSGIKRAWLFNTPEGRSLMRHELAHIRQQDGVGSYQWGYRYISAYCKAGRSYSKNKYEVDARTYQNDNCV